MPGSLCHSRTIYIASMSAPQSICQFAPVIRNGGQPGGIVISVVPTRPEIASSQISIG